MRGADARDRADWERVESLYHQACEFPASEQAAFLDSACAGDQTLRRELDELLALAPDAETFFHRFAAVIHSAAESASAPADPLIGRDVGRYRIVARLGAGGMGVVYLAHDAQLQRDVALKLMSSHLTGDDYARKRFLTEARAAAALDHPNICTIHEIGEDDSGAPYIAMAYCRGESLKQRIARGNIDTGEAVLIVLRMAHGLAAAHARGIVHGDVKPGNVMIGDDGSLKLVDFGLARLADATMTAPAQARGTFAYMAPELLRGQPAGVPSDLWSLGVVFYELLAGTRPFHGDSDAELLYRIVHERPLPIAELLPDLPPALAHIADRLLHDAVEARYRNAHELAGDLEQLHIAEPAAISAGGRRTTANASRADVAAVSRGRAQTRSAHAPTWWRWPLAGAGLAAAGTTLFFALNRPPLDAAQPPGVAVLFFQDDSPQRDANQLVGLLSEGLIDALADVPGLHVPSSNTMQPYRDSVIAVPVLAGTLGTEWLIGGRIDRANDTLAITVELIAANGRRLDSRSLAGSAAAQPVLIEDVVLAASVMVRTWIGRELRNRRWRRGSSSDAALRLVQQGVQYMEEADTLSTRTQPLAPLSVLYRADSTFARASAADPSWDEPLIQRAWVARQLAATIFGVRSAGSDSVAASINRGRQYADAAGRLHGDVARVHEVRGALLHLASVLLAGSSPDSAGIWRSDAERELTLAVESDTTLARAYNLLSSLLFGRSEFERARLTGERAYRADYYHQEQDLLYRLYETSFEVRDDQQAKKWCTLISRQQPSSPFSAHCRLPLMTWTAAAAPHADSAWQLVQRVSDAAPVSLRAETRVQLEVLAAGVIGRAGLPDSAERVLARTRASLTTDTALARNRNAQLTVLQFEAGVRLRLGQRDTAAALMQRYLAARPAMADRLRHRRVFEPLFTDARLRP